MGLLSFFAGKLDDQKKLGLSCAGAMQRMCPTCDKSLKRKTHREPDIENEDCVMCIKAVYKQMWKEDCTCIK